MKPSTISILRPAFITSTLKLGGASTFLLNIAKGLSNKKIQFLVCSMDSNHQMKKDFKLIEKNVVLFDEKENIFEDRVGHLYKRLKEFNPTHVVSTLGAASFEILRYLPSGVGRIAIIQSDDPGPYQCVKLYKKYLQAIGGVSKTIQEKLKNFPEIQKIPIGDVRYGVQGNRNKNKLGSKHLKILYCGRIVEEQKRIFLLPIILKGLDKAGLKYELTMAGGGKELREMRRLLKPWVKQKKVFITGPINQKAVSRLMSKHDVFLLFSDYEGLPISLLEALAHGLLPVVSDLGREFREIIKGTGGHVVDPRKPQNYAKAILKITKDSYKLLKYKRLCQTKWGAEYSLEAMTRRWITFLNSVPTQNLTWKEWDASPRIQAPLPLQNKNLFRPFFRPFRRMHKYFNKKICAALSIPGKFVAH